MTCSFGGHNFRGTDCPGGNFVYERASVSVPNCEHMALRYAMGRKFAGEPPTLQEGLCRDSRELVGCNFRFGRNRSVEFHNRAEPVVYVAHFLAQQTVHRLGIQPGH